MNAIRDFMLGEFSAEETKQSLRESGLDEIGFYRDAGKLEAFASLNGV